MYYAVVSGDDGTPYTLVVERNADFDAKTGLDFATAQNISGATGVLGAILPATPDDWYAIDVNAGSDLLIQTVTPGGGPEQFVNNLNPRIELYSPSDELLAAGSGDRNQSIIEPLTVSGLYRIHVSGAGTSGEYYLSVTPPLAVTSAADDGPGSLRQTLLDLSGAPASRRQSNSICPPANKPSISSRRSPRYPTR